MTARRYRLPLSQKLMLAGLAIPTFLIGAFFGIVVNAIFVW